LERRARNRHDGRSLASHCRRSQTAVFHHFNTIESVRRESERPRKSKRIRSGKLSNFSICGVQHRIPFSPHLELYILVLARSSYRPLLEALPLPTMNFFLNRLFSCLMASKGEITSCNGPWDVKPHFQLEGQSPRPIKPITQQHASPSPGSISVSDANFSPFLMLPPGHVLAEARASPPSYDTAIRCSNPSSDLRPTALSHKQLLHLTDTGEDLDATPPRSPMQRKPIPAKAKTPSPSPVSAYIKGQAPAKPRLALSSASPLAAELKAYKQPKALPVVSRKPFRGGPSKVPSIPLPLPGKKAKWGKPAIQYVVQHVPVTRTEPQTVRAPPPSPAASVQGGDSLKSQQAYEPRQTTPPQSSKQSLAGAHSLFSHEVSTIDWSNEGLARFNVELDWIKRQLNDATEWRSVNPWVQDRSLHDAPWYSTPLKPVQSHFVITQGAYSAEKRDQRRNIQVMDETLMVETML
jgi:hypothetical protein